MQDKRQSFGQTLPFLRDDNKPAKGFSFRVSLGVTLTLLVIVFSLLLAGLLDRLARREVLRLAEQNLENITLQMARELSSGMSEFTQDVQTQAQAYPLRNPRATKQEMRETLDQFVALHPEFVFFGVLDVESGTVIASNNGLFEGGNVNGRPVFEEGKKGLFLGDVHEAVRLAELLPKPANGEPLRFLDVAVPIAGENGPVTRILGAHISFEWADRVRKDILAPVKGARGIEILLVDTAGKIVLAPSDQIKTGTPLASLISHEPVASAKLASWSDGSEYLAAAAPVTPRGEFSGFGWRVIARQPAAVALAGTVTLRNSFLAGALFLSAVAAMIAWLIAGRVTGPLRALAESSRRWTANSSNDDSSGRSSIDEVAQVQDAVTKMAFEGRRYAHATEEQQRQFITFSDSLPHLVFQADASGRLEYVNHRWLDQFGSPQGIGLDNLDGILVAEDRQQFGAQWKECRQAGANFEAVARLLPNAASEAQWFKIRAQAVRNERGAVSRWVGTFTNIHQAVLESERIEKALEQERQMRAEMEHVSRMKDEFLATLSHELRTPLNVIGGWAQMLEMQAQDDSYLKKAAGIIQSNVNLQAELINDLLDMSAVIAGKTVLETEIVDGVRLIANATESFMQLAKSKEIGIEMSLPPHPVFIDADARRFNQIMTNLLSNGVKFSDGGGRISVEAAESQGKLEIRVKDGGCGIASEFLPYVFDRFRQQDSSSTRKRGGIGLGLAIVKSLVELHGGAISVASDGAGHGSMFTVTFPAVVPASALVSMPTQDRQVPADLGLIRTIGRINILLVEDDANTREMATEMLRSVGAQVSAASSAADALVLMGAKTFDLLICDIGMPDMDGYALIRKVRAFPDAATATIPAIALTAFAMKQDQDAAKKAGYQMHVTKPVSVNSLIRTIGEVLSPNKATSV